MAIARGMLGLLGLVLLAANGSEPREVVPIKGKPFAATLVAVEPSWQLVLQRGEGSKSTEERLDVAELVRWGVPADAPRQPLVFLADDGLLVAAALDDVDRLSPAALSVADDHLVLDRSLFGPLRVPLEFVRGVMLHPPAEPRARDVLAAKMLESVTADGKRRDTDLLVLENGDEVTGRFVSLDGKQVVLEAAVGKVEVPIAKLAAIVFNPSLSAQVRRTGLTGIVGYRDGSRFMARQLTLDGEQAHAVPLIIGGKEPAQDSAWSAPRDTLVFLQPLGGKVTYLSDLPIAGYKHMPYLSLEWPYKLDHAVTGSHLWARDKLYLKGLGMHSASRITFKLDKPYQRFESLLAVDDSAGGRGSVVFRVYVDTEQRYESPIVRGGETPVPVSVDVSGGKMLSLIVDFAERGDELDHADWLDARLVE